MLKSRIHISGPENVNMISNFFIVIFTTSLTYCFHIHPLELKHKWSLARPIEILLYTPLITLITTKYIIILILYYHNSIVPVFYISIESLHTAAIPINGKEKSPFPHFDQDREVHGYEVNVCGVYDITLMFGYRFKIWQAITNEPEVFHQHHLYLLLIFGFITWILFGKHKGISANVLHGKWHWIY